MSDTPRTDEIYDQFGPVLHPAVMAYNSLCVELERENAELRALLAAALEDSARIDWLQSRPRKEEQNVRKTIDYLRKMQAGNLAPTL